MMGTRGTLSRAHRLIVGERREQISLNHLNYLTESRGLSRSPRLPRTRRRSRRIRDRGNIILLKIQESAANFLFRWFLLDEIEREDNNKGENGVDSSRRRRRRKKDQTRLLLDNIELLPDKSFLNVAKFVFWRWLTWANVVELILLFVLVYGAEFHCQLFLEQYYSYPTQIRVTKVLNDDFRADLPALTICNSNTMSLETLRRKHPELNETHFLAMSLGSFQSVNNFSISQADIMRSQEQSIMLDEIRRDFLTSQDIRSSEWSQLLLKSDGRSRDNGSYWSEINWLKVEEFLSGRTVAGASNFLPEYDLVDKLTCANIWGKNVPCSNLERLNHIQDGMACVTLFHDAIFWDRTFEAVKELERELARHPAKLVFGRGTAINDGSGNLIKLDGEELLDINRSLEELDSVEMNGMEMIRVRINFRASDYANKRKEVGALVSVHSNNLIGLIRHNSHITKYGQWYSYYVERFDYKRLEYPYRDNCYDYEKNRLLFRQRHIWEQENSDHIYQLIKHQASKLGGLLQEYAESLRLTSMGSVSSKVIFIVIVVVMAV